MQNRLLLVPAFLIYSMFAHAQALDFTAVLARGDFSRTLQEWDGFGFNYVETAHTADMSELILLAASREESSIDSLFILCSLTPPQAAGNALA